MIKIKVIATIILLSVMFMLSNDTDSTLQLSQATEIDKIESVHICFDSTHIRCDGECECDGLGCK